MTTGVKRHIKNRFTGAVIYECEAYNTMALVEVALRSGADLSAANLYGVNLSGAYL
jgi:uncharacterized protein YjbI with pentapeptide repeats